MAADELAAAKSGAGGGPVSFRQPVVGSEDTDDIADAESSADGLRQLDRALARLELEEFVERKRVAEGE